MFPTECLLSNDRCDDAENDQAGYGQNGADTGSNGTVLPGFAQTCGKIAARQGAVKQDRPSGFGADIGDKAQDALNDAAE